MPLDKQPWTDATIMPWGKHKGLKLEDVPADYLHWLIEQKWITDWPGLHVYLKKHADQIYEEAQELQDERGDVEGYDSYEDYKSDIRN